MGGTLPPSKVTSKNVSYENIQGSILPGHPWPTLQQACSSRGWGGGNQRQPTKKDWIN